MKFLKKTFSPKEVRAALGVLDEAACRFDTNAFESMHCIIEKILLSKPDDFVSLIKQSGHTPREWVYSQISNIAGDMLESGQHHIYRGTLNPIGPGNVLLQMFDVCYDD